MKFYVTLILHPEYNKATITVYNYETKKNFINWNMKLENAEKALSQFKWNGLYYEMIK